MYLKTLEALGGDTKALVLAVIAKRDTLAGLRDVPDNLPMRAQKEGAALARSALTHVVVNLFAERLAEEILGPAPAMPVGKPPKAKKPGKKK